MLLTIVSVLMALIAVATAVAYYFGLRYSTSPRKPDDQKPGFKALNALKGSGSPSLSVVIPAYNEEERLTPTLEVVASFCGKHIKEANAYFRSFEVIVVDDCSKDGTRDLAKRFGAAHPEIIFSLVEVKPNRGKGHAVRTGFLNSSGDFVLMVDADNATEFSDIAKVLAAMKRADTPIGIGSRSHLEALSIATRTLGRTILMKGFHFVVSVTYFMATRGTFCPFHDTQCGFKVFRRKDCEPIFLNNRLERWAFDVELLLLAKRFALKGVEVPVRWEEIPGSKVRISGMIQMGLECLLMCFTYGFGLWSVDRK